MSAQIPSHPTPVYLVINAGGSDLKLLGRDKKAIDIDRTIHENILEHPNDWLVVPKAYENAHFVTKTIMGKESEVAITQDDKCCLVAATLQEIVEELKDKSSITFCGALVLYTHRNKAADRGNKEPIAVGPVLAQWLATAFDLGDSVEIPEDKLDKLELNKVSYFSFLMRDERLEGDKSSNGLNPLAIARLQGVMKQVSQLDSALVAYIKGGAMPDYRSYLFALAELHFQQRWMRVETHEHAKHTFVPSSHAAYITDADLVQARANSVRLLRHWDIHGAAAAINHLPSKQSIPEWAEVVTALDRFVVGLPVPKLSTEFEQALADFTNNPLGWKKRKLDENADIEEGDPTPFRFLLPAIRAESAVRGERWTEALAWTYTFYDAILNDLVELFFRTVISTDFIEMKGKDVKYKNPAIPPSSLSPLLGGGNWFSYQSLRYNDTYPMNNAKNAFKKLDKFFAKVNGWKSDDWKTTYVAYKENKVKRNINTHTVLSAADVETLKDDMTKKQLWLPSETNGLLTLIGTPLAKNCLRTFGKENLDEQIIALHKSAMQAMLA